MTPIHIDLRDLTQAHVDEAMPHLGACHYASPCIIGTLIPKDRRAELDAFTMKDGSTGSPGISLLIERGVIVLPVEQYHQAETLQDEFDIADQDPARFLKLAAKWVEAEPCS